MNLEKKYHAFLGLCPPSGLIPRWRSLTTTAPASSMRLQPWYKLHLTLHFWGALTRANFIDLLAHLRHWNDNTAMPESQIRGVDVFARHSVLYLRETSQEITGLRALAKEFILSLPDHLQGEIRDEFIPHWTIARKFHPEQNRELRDFAQSLQNFEYTGRTPAMELYFSAAGIYEPHTLRKIF